LHSRVHPARPRRRDRVSRLPAEPLPGVEGFRTHPAEPRQLRVSIAVRLDPVGHCQAASGRLVTVSPPIVTHW